ncbi:glycoside hydrolase family 53 protein [Flavobacterium sp. W22_SRS_FP1]|uniref:glycoside hydrolase family 53 protein n=1 Tax=Flavobacterium sp. W22_SRS_FP1 TaxID=3240276 RepID=UPI003F8FC365
MIKIKNIGLLLGCLLFVTSCNSQTNEYQNSVPVSIDTGFVKGADVGWLSQMEATGYKFYDAAGTEKDCLQILKDRGINTIRLRVWVNPSNDKASGHCNAAETVVMALRAQKMGMRIMIDFHYSDSWADPGKQFKPKAWETHSFSELLADVYNHTFDVLIALKKVGVTPEWVQVGNEIPGGMLWPEGSTKNWPELAQLLNKGFEATKAVDTKIKVIVHLDEGNNNEKFRWFFDSAKENNVKYDIIGLSYYPFWIKKDYTETIVDLENNLKDMAARYNKEVMIVEVGGEYDKVLNTFDMLSATIKAVKNVPNNKGLGVIYWEPQGENTWSGYSLSAWGSDGKPTAALDAFKE